MSPVVSPAWCRKSPVFNVQKFDAWGARLDWERWYMDSHEGIAPSPAVLAGPPGLPAIPALRSRAQLAAPAVPPGFLPPAAGVPNNVVEADAFDADPAILGHLNIDYLPPVGMPSDPDNAALAAFKEAHSIPGLSPAGEVAPN